MELEAGAAIPKRKLRWSSIKSIAASNTSERLGLRPSVAFPRRVDGPALRVRQLIKILAVCSRRSRVLESESKLGGKVAGWQDGGVAEWQSVGLDVGSGVGWNQRNVVNLSVQLIKIAFNSRQAAKTH